ncbi:MAG: autotransporter domain-containing protein [Planctomycetaceae bacterium]|nr:autotransporter domain-containing protein [Planctomycetaceae bacterium]
MNGFTSELLVKKARKNWRTRCGAFLLAVVAAYCGGDAYGQATLTYNRGNGLTVSTDQNLVEGNPATGNIAAPRYTVVASGANAVTWSLGTNPGYPYNALGLDLADIGANYNLQARVQNAATPPVTSLQPFIRNDGFTSNTADFFVSDNVTWTGAFNATGGTFFTNGWGLTVQNFANTGTFAVNDDNIGGNVDLIGRLVLTGGSNSGTINIGATTVRVQNTFTNGGVINIGNTGVLELAPNYNLGGTVNGQGYNGNNFGRGTMQLSGNAQFSGAWTGNITVSSGPASYYNGFILNAINADGTGLNTFQVTDGSCVAINSQNNVGNNQIILANGGTIAKVATIGVLTLTNNIQFDYGPTTVGEGSIDAWGTVVDWRDDFDFIYDTGNRVILTGNINSVYTRNTTFQVNAWGGIGAVSIQGNNTYDGTYQINSGTLEVDGGARLGPQGNPTTGALTQLTIGNASDISNTMSSFRVINAQNTTDTIGRRIELAHENAFYEVFTGDIATSAVDNDSTIADAARFEVRQSGVITGAGSLNKSGDGILTLAASANGYTGDTNIHHGVLQISNNAQINDTLTHFIRVGTADYDANGSRPVLETKFVDAAGAVTSGTLSINLAKVEINQVNSVIRTTGKDNQTIINTEVTSSPVAGITSFFSNAPVLNKEGAGTLTLNGNGTWGWNKTGETNIVEGTLQFSSKSNLASGNITIGLDIATVPPTDIFRKDIESSPADYEAILKLTDGVGYQNLPNNVVLGSATNSIIEVGAGSNLGVNQVSEATAVSADLNKRGEGELTLNGISTYTGWTNIEAGQITLTKKDQIALSKGVDLIGENTTLDMTAADQTLNGLRGGITGAAGDPRDFRVDSTGYKFQNRDLDDPQYWTRQVLIGNSNLTIDVQNTKAGDPIGANYFRGNIVGSGTVTKKGGANTVFGSGFIGFDGAFDIQSGRLQTFSDTYITGITGKAGSFLDVLDNTLTIDIAANQKYSGTIISSTPPVPYAAGVTRPHIIKEGVGTLTAGFFSDPTLTGVGEAFRGDLTMKQGNIISTTDYRMAGGGTLTFYVDAAGTGTITPHLLKVGENAEKTAVFGTASDAVNVKVVIDCTATSWKAPKGCHLVGYIQANANSFYNLVPDAANSLFHDITIDRVSSASREDRHVNLKISGFSAIGNTHNTISVGENLDNVRVLNLAGNNLENLLKDMWAAGSNIADAKDRAYKTDVLLGLYQQLSGDTIANAAFMGLDRPWQRAFEHLNLDSQMVYLTPPGASGPGGQRPIVNMRNLWFTPTVQSISARSDDNGRSFGIERSGFQIGFDKRVAQNTSLGFVLGQSSPNLRTADDRIEGNDFQFGLYGGTMIGYYVEMKGFIGFGHQTYKSNRSVYFPNDPIISDCGAPVVDPIASACGGASSAYRAIGGVQRSMTAHGRFDGDTFNFSFEVARPLFLGFAILRPTIGLDSEHAYRYAFTETGDAIAMQWDRASLSRTRMRLGFGMESCTFDRAIFKGYLGYSANLGGNDYATAAGQFVNVHAPKQAVRSVAVGKSYFDAAVGTKIFLNASKTLALDANYNASIADRWSEHLGDVGFIYVY